MTDWTAEELASTLRHCPEPDLGLTTTEIVRADDVTDFMQDPMYQILWHQHPHGIPHVGRYAFAEALKHARGLDAEPTEHHLGWLNQICSAGGASSKQYVYGLEEACELQGLPRDFTADMPFTKDAKLKAVANGVPLPMGRAVAQAVRRAMQPEPHDVAAPVARRADIQPGAEGGTLCDADSSDSSSPQPYSS